MTARSRTENHWNAQSGTYFDSVTGVTQTRVRTVGETATCNDIVGNRNGVNPLGIVRKVKQRGSWSGKQMVGPTLRRELRGWTADSDVEPVDPYSVYGILDLSSQQQLLREAIISSSPSNPYVHVPVAISELCSDEVPSIMALSGRATKLWKSARTLPWWGKVARLSMLTQALGESVLEAVANGYIYWRWAVRPMVSDVQRLLNFQRAVAKRVAYIQRLERGEQVTRRISIRSREERDYFLSDVNFTTSFGSVIRATRRRTSFERVWASVRWKSTLPPKAANLLEPIADVRKTEQILRGITSYEALLTLWELTPWSWFADWFGHVGDILSLSRNSIPAYWSDLCVMRNTLVRVDYEPTPGTIPSWCTYSGPHMESMERKERVTDTALWFPSIPPVHFPLLDAGKWSILLALTVARLSRKENPYFRAQLPKDAR